MLVDSFVRLNIYIKARGIYINICCIKDRKSSPSAVTRINIDLKH